MDDRGKSSIIPQYIAALSICLGAVAAGAVLGWTANTSDELKDSKLNNLKIDDDILGWLASFVTLGAMIICIPIGFVCDFIGRKWGCLITVFPFLIGWLLIIFSTNINMIYVGRFLNGVAGGAFCVAAPIYTSEISESSVRGALGSYFQLLQTVGILVVYIGGAYMQPKPLAILAACIPIIFAIVFFFQPESPVYLIKKKKYDEAKKALQRLRGSSYNCEPEFKEIQQNLESGSSAGKSFMESLLSKAGLTACFISFSLMLLQQLSGVNAVIFYTNMIFTDSKSSLSPAIGTIIVGALQSAATFISSLIIDKFGRKILLLASILFMGLSECTLGVFYTLKNTWTESELTSIGFLPVMSLGIYIVMFSIGFGPIPWLLSAEVMPEEIKSTMCSIAATFNWFLAFIVTKFYINLNTSIGGDVTFYIFSGICFVGVAFVLLFVPETKGKSATEIQALLNGDSKKMDEKIGIDNPTFST